MGDQDIEIKKDLVSRLLKKEGRSPYFAQGLFLGLGLVLTLSAFLILQSFIQGLSQEERGRLNQGFVEGVVEDFYQLNEPLEAVSRLISLSEGQRAGQIKKVLSGEADQYAYYSQILWFQKPEGKGWSFSSLLNQQTKIDTQVGLKADSALLKALLAQGVQGFSKTRIVKEVGGFKPAQLRQSPKILATPVVLARAVNVAEPERGFLVAVLNVDGLFDENWINTHKELFYVRVQPVESNVPLFEFERNPGESMSVREYGQTYEFPFAGRNLEVTSAFVENQRAKFLSFFPYIVAVFGLLMAGAGTVYIRHSQGQADVLADMNEALEQKNFELKIEADERERLSEAVREAEVQSRAMIDAVGDIIFETDDSGHILFLNAAWQEITGFDTEQSKGQKLSQLIHQQDQEKVEQGFKALLDGKKKPLSCYTQIRVSDGTFKAVELSVNIIQGSGESGMRLIGTFRDIEERRKVERALSDAEKKYRSIVENAAGGIFQLTPEGLYLSANPALARILGYDSAEQLLRDVKNANEQLYVNADQRSGFYKKLMTANETLSQETQMRRKDGGIIWVDESARAVADENGQILFIEGSIEDITQRKESEQAIREAKVSSDLANRAKSEFLSNMSHELRTPLNSIIGFSEMIKNEVYGKIEHRAYWEYARDIYDSGQKLLRVINEILDISKIEAGERQLNEGVVNIKVLVEGVIDLLDVKIENTQMVITQALDDVPDIIGEELALKQIVMNLLSNAVKYTPDKGRITISAHVNRDGRLHFSVTDTGIGLDEYEIKKALSPFGQVDNELSRSGSGTGLGLTLVDALVKLHGGDFELFSQKGIGTTATVILPADRVVKKDQQEGEKRAEFIDVKEQKPKSEDIGN